MNIFNGVCHEFVENFKKVYRSERRRLKRKKRAHKNKELDDCSLHLSEDDPNCPEKENNVTDNTEDYKTEYDEMNISVLIRENEAPQDEINRETDFQTLYDPLDIAVINRKKAPPWRNPALNVDIKTLWFKLVFVRNVL